MQIRLDLAHHGLLAWVGAAEQHALRGQLRGLGTYQSGCLQGSCDHRLANVISHLGQQVHVCCLRVSERACTHLPAFSPVMSISRGALRPACMRLLPTGVRASMHSLARVLQ
eukprot:scaffold79398_cov16-Tisochrysis_lutea.AAC.1